MLIKQKTTLICILLNNDMYLNIGLCISWCDIYLLKLPIKRVYTQSKASHHVHECIHGKKVWKNSLLNNYTNSNHLFILLCAMYISVPSSFPVKTHTMNMYINAIVLSNYHPSKTTVTLNTCLVMCLQAFDMLYFIYVFLVFCCLP